MAYMKVCRLAPTLPTTISLRAEVSSVKLRPDEQVEICYHVAGGHNSDSIIVSASEALRLLGVGWDEEGGR